MDSDVQSGKQQAAVAPRKISASFLIGVVGWLMLILGLAFIPWAHDFFWSMQKEGVERGVFIALVGCLLIAIASK